MDEGTALVLALQLLALAAIAAALLLYLLCRLRPAPPATGPRALSLAGDPPLPGAGRALLVTAADSALGLQVALRLADRGFRVFAGLKDPDGEGAAARAIRAWQKAREGLLESEGALGLEAMGSLTPLRLDVTREDLLHEAATAVRGRLPAGEDGLWAVVNTAGLWARGRLEAQDSAVWDALLKHNVVGALRAARALMPLLRCQKGRLVLVGAAAGGAEAEGEGAAGRGLVAFTAARFAVEGLAAALRPEAAAAGVDVITLQPQAALAEALYRPPRRPEPAAGEKDLEKGSLEASATAAAPLDEAEYRVLPERALRTLEEALVAEHPKDSYPLSLRHGSSRGCLSRLLGNRHCHAPAAPASPRVQRV